MHLLNEAGLHGGYDPFFFHNLAVIEDRHFWFRARNVLIFELTRRISSQLKPGYRVLEVGCGTGNVLRVLCDACPGGRVVGLDLWVDGLRYARKRATVPLVQGDICSLPFDAHFDLIGMFDVLEHIASERDTLLALRNALVPSGKLMLTVPAHQFLWSHSDEAWRHCRRYSPDSLRRRLSDAGFEVEFMSQFMACIFPIAWTLRRLSGFRQKRSLDNNRKLAAREFSVVPVLNDLLASLLGIEVRWLLRGHTLPIGTSIIVVAKLKGTHHFANDLPVASSGVL
jgi:SAM-dependent methyltransferase